MAGQVINYLSDAMIDTMINRIEGVIDIKLKIGTNGSSFTISATKAPHFVVEGAATYGAALLCCGPSLSSWNTLDQLVVAQNLYTYWYKHYMDLIESEDFGPFIVEQ